MADLYKLDIVVPEAFSIAAKAQKGMLEMAPERAVRLACRDLFRKTGLLHKIIPQIEEVLAAGGLDKPGTAPEAVSPAFEEEVSGDDGHRG